MHLSLLVVSHYLLLMTSQQNGPSSLDCHAVRDVAEYPPPSLLCSVRRTKRICITRHSPTSSPHHFNFIFACFLRIVLGFLAPIFSAYYLFCSPSISLRRCHDEGERHYRRHIYYFSSLCYTIGRKTAQPPNVISLHRRINPEMTHRNISTHVQVNMRLLAQER